MRLLVLAKAARTVATPNIGTVPGEVVSEVLGFLQGQPANRQASAKGFIALFRRYAHLGRAGLTSEQFHLANQAEKIWEFRKGALRVLCFEDGDNALVVLTHGSVKKSQKTPAAEIAAALEVKKRYLSAKAAGTLNLEGLSDNDQPST